MLACQVLLRCLPWLPAPAHLTVALDGTDIDLLRSWRLEVLPMTLLSQVPSSITHRLHLLNLQLLWLDTNWQRQQRVVTADPPAQCLTQHMQQSFWLDT